MVVVTRAGRLREWSQGELRLYTTGQQTNDLTDIPRNDDVVYTGTKSNHDNMKFNSSDLRTWSRCIFVTG